ncbi:TonB-dependent receptor [uncultured Sphingomonas sp.]|uniref:TonB-dependent receptor n=1 Tax=uncultured Sphingomonas sp. TaxID=158754 RepID=UPI0025F5A049|nr:TonB-dependent receptor [uncultured Sphingomonas sp.]
MKKSALLDKVGITALCIAAAIPTHALAQTADGASPQAAATVPADDQAGDIVVTGSARAERRFDVAYAVNSLSQRDIQKIAPLNTADLLGNVPGIQVEATGGEVQNITRVRGIPTDRGYLYFQQDGLPLYQEIDGFFFNAGEGMNRYDLMTERVEVVRGGPAPIYASDAAAIVNNITVTGTATTRGRAQVTLGDTGLYRLDAYQAGPLDSNTYYAVGGFIRHHDGYRDNGFPNDRGGQIRANIKHDFANGFFKLSAQFVDDHNVFYLPIPTNDPRNPSVSLNPYINYFTGTMNSPALRNVGITFQNADGGLTTLRRDLANGRYIRFGNIGFTYEATVDDWTISLKTGATIGKNSFDAFYSTTNPVDGATFAASYLNASKTAFGASVTRMGYAIAGTNGASVYDPYSASGLVMSGQYRAIEASFYSTQGDLSVTRQFDTPIGRHDVKAGLYGSLWGQNVLQAYQDYLIEVRGKPRTLDLYAYNANGAILGSVTQNGVLRDTTTLNRGNVDARMAAVYLNDTWDVTDRLRIDAGVRHEWYGYRGSAMLSATANLGDPTTLADNATRAFTGAVVNNRFAPQATNWTAGINYDLTHHFGAYARISQLEIPITSGTAFGTSTVPIASKARQYEVGLKAVSGGSYLYLTGFYTKFDPLNASFIAYNPVTGRNDQAVTFVGTAVTKGIEADGRLAVGRTFSLAGSVTVGEPQYKNLANNVGADPSAVNGKQIIREPKVYGHVRPTVDFDIGATHASLYGSYEYTSKRYTDFFNQTALPAFGSFGAGVMVTNGPWLLQVVGDNLTNAHGLTEGNTRTDSLSGQGNATAIYGRPVFGRNFRLIVSRSW